MAVQTPVINEDKLNAFLGQVVGELGATVNAGLIVIGDRLGLYKAMADAGPITPAELATKTGTTERYVREWLNAQAAGGFVVYDPANQSYELPAEQALCLANEDSPAFVCGAFELATATLRAGADIESAFKTGRGFGWHEHDHGVATGCERFFRPGYNANLVSAWLPALDGVEAKLRVGAKVADVGCGLGASTRLMASCSRNTSFGTSPGVTTEPQRSCPNRFTATMARACTRISRFGRTTSPSSRVKTYPVSAHDSPQARRSSSWRRR